MVFFGATFEWSCHGADMAIGTKRANTVGLGGNGSRASREVVRRRWRRVGGGEGERARKGRKGRGRRGRRRGGRTTSIVRGTLFLWMEVSWSWRWVLGEEEREGEEWRGPFRLGVGFKKQCDNYGIILTWIYNF